MREEQAFRINIFRILLLLVFIAYVIRLFGMQILSGEVYRTRAQDISRRTYSIPTQRGEIYDRNYTRPLVINRDSYAVSITPAEIPRSSIDEVIKSAAKILNLSYDEIIAMLPNQYFQIYQPIEIATNVPFNIIAALAERKNTLPGISWQIKAVRNYVNVGSLSHILGYVGNITRDELTTLYNQGYQQGDEIGKLGVERQYDELLRGKKGWETRTVDVRGRRITGRENVVRVPPEMGKNLVLTIDAELQTLAEKALGPRIGTVVVMRPTTGEVLAMVSYPWYDPNIFTEGLASDYRALADDPSKPFLNRAIQSSFPPASTFKIIMTTGILAENAFPTEQTVLCPGFISYGGRDWNCHVRRPGHGRLNLRGGMAQSCDIYYWTVGRDYLGENKIATYAGEYGYGKISGIDLPGEIEGFIPTPQWKERRFHERWVAGDTMNMSIGQGYTLTTPLQVTNLLNMVVNSGNQYKPYVLKEVRDPSTNVIESVVTPQLIHESDISPAIFERVRQDMRAVVTEGTGSWPVIRAAQTAGKTGTAEIGLNDRWHAWYVAFGPYNAPPEEQITLAVIVEATNNMEWRATYTSSIILQGYFAKQNYETAVRALGLQYLIPLTEQNNEIP